MSTVHTGDLISARGTRVWRGNERTNGFLMRNSDGRVPAITQSGTLDMSLNLVTPDVLPYGNLLVRVLPEASSGMGVNNLKSGVGTGFTSGLQVAGVAKYEPGIAASHPVQNWGIAAYNKFTVISRGIVGYKFSQKAGQTDADYLQFLQGDQTRDPDKYETWVTALSAATVPTGSNLYLCFSLLTGFPKVIVGGPVYTSVNPGANYVLVGQALVFEPENEMIGFEIDGRVVFGSA